MKIVMTGGTGFLGRPLAAALVQDGHHVSVLSRRANAHVAPGARAVFWDPDHAVAVAAAEVDGAGAVINLAGEPIAGRRWTAAQKRRIEDSRVVVTRQLVTAVADAAAPPAVLISGSGVGFYGWCDDRVITEETPSGHDFLAAVSAGTLSE